MPKATKIKIRKEEGRNVRFYDVYTAEYIDRILGGSGSGSGSGSTPDPTDPFSGIGRKIGVITEDLNGVVSSFGVRLTTAISAGRDYLVVSQEGGINVFTPNADVNVGEGTVTLGDDTTTIIALEGSPIYEQSAQQEAENREFRERIQTLNQNLEQLDLDLEELNTTILPALDEKLETLDGYFEDPNTIPANYTFFEGIVTNAIWAQQVVATQGWFNSVFTNSLMSDRIIANHIGAGQVTATKIDTADLAASNAFIGKLFAREIALVLDSTVDPAQGGLLRSTAWNGTTDISNGITGNGTQGWAIDYGGNAVFHTLFARGTMQSDNFVAGESGWQILNTGDAEFDNVIARGEFRGDHGGRVGNGDDLQSSNFETGVSGWRIQGSGDVEFRNGVFRGQVFITGGDAARLSSTSVTITYFATGTPAQYLPTQRPNGDPLQIGDLARASNFAIPVKVWIGGTHPDGWVNLDTYQLNIPVTIRSSTAPTDRGSDFDNAPIKEGDTWLKTDEGDLPHTYDGRTPFSTDGWIRAYTKINGGNIETGTILADKINVTDLFSKNITLNNGGVIQSTGFLTGSTGFQIQHNGNAEFNQIIVRDSEIVNPQITNPIFIFPARDVSQGAGTAINSLSANAVEVIKIQITTGNGSGGLDLNGIVPITVGGTRVGTKVTVMNSLNSITPSSISINNESGSATTVNRVRTPTGTAFSLARGDSAELFYDVSINRWLIVGSSRVL